MTFFKGCCLFLLVFLSSLKHDSVTIWSFYSGYICVYLNVFMWLQKLSVISDCKTLKNEKLTLNSFDLIHLTLSLVSLCHIGLEYRLDDHLAR